MTANKLIRICGVEYDNPVGKRLDLDQDGKSIRKITLTNERGAAGRIINKAFATPKELFEFRKTSDARRMFVMGTFAPEIDNGMALPAGAVDAATRQFEPHARPTIVSLTKEHLAFREGPGLLSIDVDHKDADEVAAMFPERAARLQSPKAVLDAFYEICPEARDCPIMVTPSASSMIERAETGELIRGAGGWRILIPIDNAVEIPRVLEVLHRRCWARELHHHAFVSAGGAVCVRSLVDLALKRPTQPDYPTADLGEGLRKSRGATVMESLDGAYLVGASVLLDAEEGRATSVNIEAARRALAPNAQAILATRKKQAVAEAVSRGVSEERAVRAAEKRFEAGILLGTDVVVLDDGAEATVADLLSPGGKKYDQRVCFDPVEPDYDGGRPVGKFFWNDGVRPGVHSFAHGSKFYHLRYDAETARAAIDAAQANAVSMALILALSDVDAIEQTQMEAYAAKALGLGNAREPLRRSVREQQARIASYRADGDEEDDPVHSGPDLPTPLGDKLDQSSFPQFRVTSTGVKIIDHQDNIAHLLASYGIAYRYNLISKDFEWDCPDVPEGGDHAAVALQSLLVSLCALNGVPDKNISLHLTGLGERASYNPVVEHLASLEWDGSPRFDQLADEMEADDPDIARIVLRLFLIQACAAADHCERVSKMHPEYRAHFEGVLVFVGAQGIGKTKGLVKLFPAALRKTCVKEGQILDLRNKDTVKAAFSTWCSELGELDATFKKSEISSLKAFLSKEQDEIRMPYAPKASLFKRRTVFAGTVNEVSFLGDETGNRRFWPLTVTRADVGWSDTEIDQLWAEAWARYVGGEKWWPTSEKETLLAANAERYRSKSILEQQIEDWFDWGAPPDWNVGRRTVVQLVQELGSGMAPRYEQAELKKIGNALRRLWSQNSHTEISGGVLVVRNRQGSLVKLNSDRGKNRGWFLPPRRGVQRSAANDAGSASGDHTDRDVKG